MTKPSISNEEDQRAFAIWQAEQARCSAKEKQSVPDGERPAIHTQLFSSWVRPSGRTLFMMVYLQKESASSRKPQSVSAWA